MISSSSGFGRQFRRTLARQCPFEFVDGLNVVYQTGRSSTGDYPSRHFAVNTKVLSSLSERRESKGREMTRRNSQSACFPGSSQLESPTGKSLPARNPSIV